MWMYYVAANMGDFTCHKKPCMELLLCTLSGLILGSLRLAAAKNFDECSQGLGMQSGEILASAITASSSYDPDSVGSSNGRIRTENNGGAWCPKNPVGPNSYEYLQIDLGRLHVIKMVETQGRFGNGQGQEFATMYYLDYQREDDKDDTWIRFRNRQGQMAFRGNENTYIAELREVDPPIIAKRIRFVPFSERERTVCMRVEVYGCEWKDGVVSYKMPVGARRGSEIAFTDFTYDGKTTSDNIMEGGLGQLTDGQEGQTTFRIDPDHNVRHKGYEWVGWKNESSKKPVEIIFKFDAVRNFTSMRMHCNNAFKKEIRVFRKAELYFSIGGKYFYGEPVVYNYMRDTLIEFARPVIIPLKQHIGRYIKLLLYYDAKWILISEVRFDSAIVTNGNFTEEKPPYTIPPSTLATTTLAKGSDKHEGAVDRNLSNHDNKTGRHNPMQGAAPKGTTDLQDSDRSKPHKALDDQYIGVIIGALCALILLLFIIVLIFVLRQRRKKHSNAKVIQPRNVTLNLNDLRNPGSGKLSNGNMYNSVASSDVESERDGPSVKLTNDIYGGQFGTIQSRRLPELPPTPGSVDTNTSREYAVPDLTKSAMIVNIPPEPYYPTSTYGHTMAVPPPQHRPPVPPDPHYAASDIVESLNIQGVSGNNVYAVPNPEMQNLWKEDLAVMEFPRENLKFLEQLGEGQFGEVHLCEAMRITEFLGDDFLVNRTGSRSMLVAVKMLRRNVHEHAKRDFQKEVKIMSRLKDPNIVRVLGVCTMDDPLCVIVEYMKFGDLHQFLHTHVLDTTLTRSTNLQTVSYGCLIYMASQIASGMKYLESLNMVHRDLATRNCLVGHNYTIKISDFGMSRSLYSADYYRIEGRAVLPIRWMAWESILLGRFTTKSDIWSFGVTLWEIVNFAKEQPFNNLTDEQVIENCGHYYRNDGQQLYLSHPPHCPREIYDLMCECWNRTEAHRPAFKEIHMFLQRKNMGYNPKEEKMSKFNLPVV